MKGRRSRRTRRKNRKRVEEVRRSCKEAGASFFITCGGYNPGNRVARAEARFRKPYSSIDYEEPEQSSQRLLNFLRAYRPAVLHITGKADWTRGCAAAPPWLVPTRRAKAPASIP